MTDPGDDIFGDVPETPQAAPVPPTPPPPEPPAPPAAQPAPEGGEVQKKAEAILGKLFEKGSIVTVHIGFWRGRKKLTHKDLGLKKEEAPEEIIQLGQKRLLKKSAFEPVRTVESKARGLVDTHSYESWIPGLRFMTVKSKEKVMAQLVALRTEFMTARDQFVSKYPELREQILSEFPDWRARLEPHYPSSEAVRDSFSFEIVEYDVTLARKESEILSEAKIALKDNLIGKLNGFLKSAVLDSRAELLEKLQSIKDNLDEGDKINARTVKKLTEMIETAKAKDFVGDDGFIKLLDDFQSKFGTKEGINDEEKAKQIKATLAKIIEAGSDDKTADEAVEKYHRNLIVD